MNILVIGAAGGIGSQLVSDLAEFHNLLLGYNHNMPVAQSAKLEPVDACSFDSVYNFVEKGLQEFGSVDSVINLPGNLILKPAHLSSEDEFYKTIDINLKSAFAVIRAAGSLLTDCSIILMSTAAARIGLANHELIASAKNIRVNTVSPGLVDTPLSAKIVQNSIALSASKKMHTLGEIGKPKHISNMISFLTNPENNWITGQNFVIDGGLSSTK